MLRPVVLSTNQSLDFLSSEESLKLPQSSSGEKYMKLSRTNLPAPSFPLGTGLSEAEASLPNLTSPSWAMGIAEARREALTKAAVGLWDGAEFSVPSPYQPSR